VIEERRRPKAVWLIVRDGTSGPREAVALEVAGGESLPVFSFEKAILYLDFSGLEGGWRANRSEIADTFSVLDSCSGVPLVSLDPFPEIGLHELHYLVSLRRKEFVELPAARKDAGQDPDKRPKSTERAVDN